MSRAPRWYIDEADPTVERYWNGSRWQPETRPVQAGTARFDDGAPARTPRAARVSPQDELVRLATAQLAEQQRANRLLGVIAFVLVAGLVLGAVAGLIAGLG